MTAWINIALDCTLIALVVMGLVQSFRLIRHLTELRESRGDMERFVRDFNATVLRADAGIKGLRQAARDSGDDLEALVEKATLVRDELHFIVESADQIASRLSQNAAVAVRPIKEDKVASAKPADVKPAAAPLAEVAQFVPKKTMPSESAASRAERELMQALEKLG